MKDKYIGKVATKEREEYEYGDKSTQQKDIENAKKIWDSIKNRNYESK